jgi:hypothetical protein
MPTLVGPLGGIKYGFKLLGYVVGVVIIGGVITGIGLGISATELSLLIGSEPALAGMSQDSPDLGVVLLGAGISVTGVSVTFAGILGTLYKVIADAVYTARLNARETALSDESS